MTSATLFREGPELDALLAELDAEHPGRVQVVNVEYGRAGGVLGFFAHRRVAVHYRLTGDAVEPAAAGLLPSPTLDGAGRLDGLARFDALERVDALDDEPDESQVEFARMLLELATAKAAERQAAAERDVPVEPAVPAFPTVPANPPAYLAAPIAAPVAASVAAPIATPVAASVAAPIAAPVAASVAAPIAAPVSVPAYASAYPSTYASTYASAYAPAYAPPVVAEPVSIPAPIPAAAPAPVPAAAPAPVPTALPTALPTPIPTAIPAPAGFVPPEFAVGPLPTVSDYRPHPAPEFAPAPEQPATRLPRPAGAHRAHADADSTDTAWGEYALRRRLVEVGVPVGWIPDGADNAYWVVEQLSRRVPTVLPAAAAPGQIVVVAGPADTVLAAARDLAVRLRLDPQDVFAAGCGDGVSVDRRMEPWNAGATAAQYRTRGTAPLIAAVAVDGSGAEAAEWGRQVVRALVPDRVHVVVDAGRKSSDARRTISALPAVHSLFVTGAGRTSSPASVWELDLPIEMLDGRPATQGGWAAVLIDALAALDGS